MPTMHRRASTLSFRLVTTVLFATAFLGLAACSRAQAPDPNILILVTGNPSAPTLAVRPPEKKMCRAAKANCPTEVVWVAPQQGLRDNDVLILRAKQDQPDCFGAAEFRVTKSAPDAPSGAAKCAAGSVWSYDVVLERGGQPIATLDPKVIIDP